MTKVTISKWGARKIGENPTIGDNFRATNLSAVVRFYCMPMNQPKKQLGFQVGLDWEVVASSCFWTLAWQTTTNEKGVIDRDHAEQHFPGVSHVKQRNLGSIGEKLQHYAATNIGRQKTEIAIRNQSFHLANPVSHRSEKFKNFSGVCNFSTTCH